MKLYFAPGACSLSPHIALREAGIPFTLVKTDTKTKKIEGGGDYLAINSKGYVPAIEIDNGQVLTEGPAIVQFIADLKPESNLAPKAGTLERYRLQEWLNFITSELHKGFSPLFSPDTPAEMKETVKKKLGQRFDWIVAQLGDKPYLTGDTFTIADGYLFTVLNWGQWVGVDLAAWPALKAYHARVASRPSVVEALKAEGLMKS